ncbi:MAG TPA: hypothetical protein PKK84_01370 [Armatimonadota bacterium]|nr:hypothetical protein [Armatimonadota bacterium]
MAQLGDLIRFTFVPVEDQAMRWTAEVRLRAGAEWKQEVAAEGMIAAPEVWRWCQWFSDARARRKLRGDAVSRLWTPIAGERVEFFLWKEATGGYVLMALFTKDPEQPTHRTAVEMNIQDQELAAFGAACWEEAAEIMPKVTMPKW